MIYVDVLKLGSIQILVILVRIRPGEWCMLYMLGLSLICLNVPAIPMLLFGKTATLAKRANRLVP